LLAGVGYSLNDTIVVFDRVRENMRLMRNADLAEVINVSTTQTLARTLATSASTIVVLLSLLLVGGESLYVCALTLIVGVVIGTYSSIYVANGLLISQNLTREDLIPKQLEEVDDRPCGQHVELRPESKNPGQPCFTTVFLACSTCALCLVA